MKGNWSITRPLIQRRFSILRSFSPSPSPSSSSLSKSIRSIILAPNSVPSQTVRNSLFAVSDTSFHPQRCFSSSSEDRRKWMGFKSEKEFHDAVRKAQEPKLFVLKSDEEFNNSLRKVQDESLPSIFYFTNEFSGPCKYYLFPAIQKLSQQHHVTIYKVDIDEERLSSTVKKLNIASVPTLHFYSGGKKEAEMVGIDGFLTKIIGANVLKLKEVMARVYVTKMF